MELTKKRKNQIKKYQKEINCMKKKKKKNDDTNLQNMEY